MGAHDFRAVSNTTLCLREMPRSVGVSVIFFMKWIPVKMFEKITLKGIWLCLVCVALMTTKSCVPGLEIPMLVSVRNTVHVLSHIRKLFTLRLIFVFPMPGFKDREKPNHLATREPPRSGDEAFQQASHTSGRQDRIQSYWRTGSRSWPPALPAFLVNY